jgi:hypothetical protein
MPVSLAEEFLTVPAEERPALLAQAIAEQWDMQRVRQVLRAERIEYELPSPQAQPEPRPSPATTDTIEGSFREVDDATDQLPQVAQPISAENTPRGSDLVRQLHLARDLIRELRPYELTPTQERALGDLLHALLRLARARQRGAKGPVFPTFEEAERLAKGR